jgi:hypothetical protein
MGFRLRWGSWSLEELDGNFKELQQKKLIPNLCGAEAVENWFIIHNRWFPFLDRSLVVTVESAGRYFGRVRRMPKTDHFTIVKPRALDHPSHLFLIDFLTNNGFVK